MTEHVRRPRRPTIPRTLLGCFIAAALACGAPDEAADSSRRAGDQRPNIIVLLVDDLRWDDIGAAGHPFVETPNIDRIAHEGARFLNAFATTPLCSPSRGSFLTGLYAHSHGITDNLARNETSHQLPTFPRSLQTAGYETAFIGKWHMGNDDSPRPGFDRWVGMRGQGEAVDPLLNVDGTRSPTEGYVTDLLTDFAVEFIEEPRDVPFMLYVSHKALHPNIQQRDDGSSAELAGQPSGFVAAERHRGRYAEAPVPRRPNASAPIEGKPALQRPIEGLPPLTPGGGTPDRTVRQRLEMLLGVDESTGRILDTLERLGELDRTVVVLAGDHGYFYGEHGLTGERRLAYEETARIPLLIRYPALIPAASTPEQMVLNIDLAPTLLALGQAEPPQPLDGRSLLPILQGDPAPDWRTSFLIEYYTDTVFPRIFHMGYQAVRTDRYKYIDYLELEGMEELYDLAEDPFETTNLVDDPDSQALLREMQAELARLTEGLPAREGS